MIWQDDDGTGLTIRPCAGGRAAFTVTDDLGRTVTACVEPHWLPDIMLAAYRAAGQVPPVMIGRPGIDPARGCRFGALEVAAAAGGVMFRIGGNGEALDAAMARKLAAAAVAIADAASADPEAVAVLEADIAEAGTLAGAAGLARHLAALGYRREDAPWTP